MSRAVSIAHDAHLRRRVTKTAPVTIMSNANNSSSRELLPVTGICFFVPTLATRICAAVVVGATDVVVVVNGGAVVVGADVVVGTVVVGVTIGTATQRAYSVAEEANGYVARSL